MTGPYTLMVDKILMGSLQDLSSLFTSSSRDPGKGCLGKEGGVDVRGYGESNTYLSRVV